MHREVVPVDLEGVRGSRRFVVLLKNLIDLMLLPEVDHGDGSAVFFDED